MGKRGPKPVSAEQLYPFAYEFYRDLRRLAEGYPRLALDQERFEKVRKSFVGLDLLSEEERTAFDEREEMIQTARLSETERRARRRLLELDIEDAMDEQRHPLARKSALKQIIIPGKPEVLENLLQAKTPECVREICSAYNPVGPANSGTLGKPGARRRRIPNWPVAFGSTLPYYLSLQAEAFIAAKNSVRFPCSDRPSNRLKQFWFLARALAGAVFGVRARTAINILGSTRPEEILKQSRAAKQPRKKRGARQ